jgi:hypothetical protein
MKVCGQLHDPAVLSWDKSQGTISKGGLVGPRTALDAMKKREASVACSLVSVPTELLQPLSFHCGCFLRECQHTAYVASMLTFTC